VCSRIIDGDRWIAERRRFLRERLAGDLSAEERTACEAELEALSKERGLTVRGRRAAGLLRHLRRKR
jgi:hypothetical protein